MIYPSRSIDRAKQQLYLSRFESTRIKDSCTARELARIYCKDQRKRAQFRKVDNIPTPEPYGSNNHYSYEEDLWCHFGIRPQIETHGIISPDASYQLMKLPNEILFKVLESATVCSATCFGLTCHTIYNLFKTIYPHRVYLDELDSIKVNTYEGNETDFTICLGLLLANWRGIGPRFRLWEVNVPRAFLREEAFVSAWRFVPKETYGTILDQSVVRYSGQPDKDTGLFLRYQDHALMEIDGFIHLPNPWNRVQKEWEREVMDLAVWDRRRYLEQDEWITFWERTRIWYDWHTKIMIEEMDLRRDAIFLEMMARGIR
jgi:hypothetical protein